MNTKFFKSLAAVAVAVLTVGCAKEQGTQEGPANVTFEIENPVAVTKAIGDGTTAKNFIIRSLMLLEILSQASRFRTRRCPLSRPQ